MAFENVISLSFLPFSASIAGSVQSNSDFAVEKLEGAGKEFADEVHFDAYVGGWIQQLAVRKARKV